MNIKRISFCIVCSLFASIVFSQELGTYQKVELGINGIGISLEIPATQKLTIEPAIGFGPSYDLNNHGDALTDKMDWHWALLEPSLHVSVHGKLFYGRDKRAEKGKSMILNSGQFIGLKIKYVSKSLSDPQYYCNTLLTNINWGVQQSLGKHFLFSCSVGVGYGRNLDYSYGLFYPALDAKIAYVLPFFSKGK